MLFTRCDTSRLNTHEHKWVLRWGQEKPFYFWLNCLNFFNTERCWAFIVMFHITWVFHFAKFTFCSGLPLTCVQFVDVRIGYFSPVPYQSRICLTACLKISGVMISRCSSPQHQQLGWWKPVWWKYYLSLHFLTFSASYWTFCFWGWRVLYSMLRMYGFCNLPSRLV